MQQDSGKEHFRGLYQSGVDEEAQWLNYGATHNADSVQLLGERNKIAVRNMLELGAGIGAVIQECRRRGLASRYTAVDYSPEAISYLTDSCPGIEASVADISAPEFALQGEFDVVVLSHVLEHLEEPGRFLRSLGSLHWRYAVAEVPLENLLASRLKQRLTGELPGMAAGHVQLFTAAAFRKLLEANGLVIADSCCITRTMPCRVTRTIKL